MSLSAKKRARRIRGQWAEWWRSRPVVDPEYGVSFVDPRTGKTAKAIGTFTDYDGLLRHMKEKTVKVPVGCICEVPGAVCPSHPWGALVSTEAAVQNFQRALFDRMTGKKAAPEGYGMTPRPDPAKYEIGEYDVIPFDTLEELSKVPVIGDVPSLADAFRHAGRVADGLVLIGTDLAASSDKTTQVTVERRQNDRGEWEVSYVGAVGEVADPSVPAIPRRGVVPFYESMMKVIGRQVLPDGYEVVCDPGASGKPLAIVDMKGLERALDRSARVKP